MPPSAIKAAPPTPPLPAIAVETRHPSPEDRLGRILFDATYAHGLQATLAAIYRLGSLVRDRISIDTWCIINRFDQDFLLNQHTGVWLNELIPALDRLIITFAAFGGLAMESMTRGYAWRFLDMGRRVERSLATLGLLRGTLVPVVEREAPLLEAVLEIADSSMTYRRRYMTTLQAVPVLDLLLVDETNPALGGLPKAGGLTEHVEALPRIDLFGPHTAGGNLLVTALAQLRNANLQAETEPDADGERGDLDQTLATLMSNLYGFSDAISESYLSHATPSRQLQPNAHSALAT